MTSQPSNQRRDAPDFSAYSIDMSSNESRQYELESNHANEKVLRMNENVGEEVDEKAVEIADLEASTDRPIPVQTTILTGIRFWLVVSGMMLSIFLVTLDRVIVATALPVIASRFNELEQAPWIASAYFLTQAGFILFFGQLLTITDTKWTYVVSIVIFAFGSLLCGVAWNFEALIVGRAVGGVGGGGIFVACLVIIAKISRLEQRPMIFGLFGASVALASIVGPLLGGSLTDHASWRWCFYINLPFCAFAIAVVLLFLQGDYGAPSMDEQNRPLWKRLAGLDWIGNTLFLGVMTTLLLALQWGGVQVPWSDKSIIICLVIFASSLCAFILWEAKLGPRATLPLSIFKRRTSVGVAIVAFMVMCMTIISTYYLPIYYQAAQGKDATQAGLSVLPLMLATVSGTILGGWFTSRTGRPWVLVMIFPSLAAIASGLVFWALSTSQPRASSLLIGFQILLGFSNGASVQQTMVLIQTEFKKEPKMIPQASAMVNAFQLTGAVVGVAIAAAILNNHLRAILPKFAPGISPGVVEKVVQSVSAIADLDDIWKTPVKQAYSEAVGYVFLYGIGSGLIATLASFLIENISLKE